MMPTEPLPIHHSWPLYDRAARFDLGRIDDGEGLAGGDAWTVGRWSCDLATEAVTWSPGVYALFGLDAAVAPVRTDMLRLYRAESLGPLERLRAYAIRHCRGFTLDTRIVTRQGIERWMRIVATPVCRDGRTVRLEGVKQDVTATYRPDGLTPRS